MTHTVLFSPRARGHLNAIYDYIADQAEPEIARTYTRHLEEACRRLDRFPARGIPRDDIRPGLRTLSLKRRAIIVFSIEGNVVVIHGVFYAGQDFEAAFVDDEGPEKD